MFLLKIRPKPAVFYTPGYGLKAELKPKSVQNCQNAGFFVLFHCFDTVFNDEKSVFYAGFGISTLENPGIRSLLTYVSLKIEKRSKTVKIPDFQPFFTVLTRFSIMKNQVFTLDSESAVPKTLESVLH